MYTSLSIIKSEIVEKLYGKNRTRRSRENMENRVTVLLKAVEETTQNVLVGYSPLGLDRDLTRKYLFDSLSSTLRFMVLGLYAIQIVPGT